MEWLAKQNEGALAPAVIAAKASIPVHDKGKRKIVDRMEEEQSDKF